MLRHLAEGKYGKGRLSIILHWSQLYTTKWSTSGLSLSKLAPVNSTLFVDHKNYGMLLASWGGKLTNREFIAFAEPLSTTKYTHLRSDGQIRWNRTSIIEREENFVWWVKYSLTVKLFFPYRHSACRRFGLTSLTSTSSFTLLEHQRLLQSQQLLVSRLFPISFYLFTRSAGSSYYSITF